MSGQYDSVLCGAILLSEIAVVLFVILASRAPLRAFGALLRVVGLFRGRQAPPPPEEGVALNLTPDLKARLGASAWAPLLRALRPQTETDKALAAVDPGFARDDGRQDGPYDYGSTAEKKLERHGILFHWIAVKPSYITDRALISDDLVERYIKAARRFFRGQVNVSADVASLYEDVEAANIISMFRTRDRDCYYLMHQMRRIINDNVRKLAFVFSSVLLAILVVQLFLVGPLGLGAFGSPPVPGVGETLWHRSIAGLMLCAAGAFVMWLVYYMEYAPYQRNNGRELRSFLSRYLSRQSDRYRDSLANARAVTVGDETNGAKLSAEAQKWHKIMLWLSFRAFFIETFVRNILFQIGRNCGYYVVLVPFGLFVLVLVTLFTFVDIDHLNLLKLVTAPGPVFYGAFAVLIVLAFFFFRNSMNSIDEMNQADWLGFDNFNVDRGMDEVVGKYAEDVGYWKGRLER